MLRADSDFSRKVIERSIRGSVLSSPSQGQEAQARRLDVRPQCLAENKCVTVIASTIGQETIDKQPNRLARSVVFFQARRFQCQDVHCRRLDPGMVTHDPRPPDEHAIVAHDFRGINYTAFGQEGPLEGPIDRSLKKACFPDRVAVGGPRQDRQAGGPAGGRLTGKNAQASVRGLYLCQPREGCVRLGRMTVSN